MPNTLRFKTNLNCSSCVAAVQPYLDSEPSISHWDVNTAVPEKMLTVEGNSVSAESVKTAVEQAGFKLLGDVPMPLDGPAHDSTPPVTYYPLGLLVGYLIAVVALLELRTGSFHLHTAMQNFMGGFFIAFSFFKLLDLRGFADSYRMYDIVAKRFGIYGYIYPFIELLLGAAYLSGFLPVATNLVTVVVMSISSIGVVQSVLAKRKIRCACLGTVFNLPMSTITLVEDALMVVMALGMLTVSF